MRLTALAVADAQTVTSVSIWRGKTRTIALYVTTSNDMHRDVSTFRYTNGRASWRKWGTAVSKGDR